VKLKEAVNNLFLRFALRRRDRGGKRKRAGRERGSETERQNRAGVVSGGAHPVLSLSLSFSKEGERARVRG